MIIYLCRHGQTTGDIEDRYGGDYDDHLTDLGKNQAIALSNKLAGKAIEKIYSSTKIRAIETANLVNKALACEITEVPDLRERNQNGILTGMVRSEAKEKYPDLAEKLKDYKNTITGAEDYESFSKRVLDALFKIAAENHKVVAVVTHGGPIKVVLRKSKYFPDYKIEDCAFAELEVKGSAIRIIKLNGIEPRD